MSESGLVVVNLKAFGRYFRPVQSSKKMAHENASWLAYAPFVAFPIALCPKAVQLAIFILVLALLMIRFRGRILHAAAFSSAEGLLLCFISIYLLSILFNSVNAEGNRVLAAFNTWATWVVATLFYSFYRLCGLNRDRVSKVAFINIIILIFLALLHYSGIQIVLPWGSRLLSGGDWINGERSIRLYAFLEYSTLVAAMYFIFFPLSLRTVTKWRCKWLAYGYCVLAIVPVIACASRTGILLGAVVTLVALFYIDSVNGNDKLTRNAKLVLVFLVIAFFIAIFHTEIIAFIERLLNSRQGSTNTRRALYEYSFGQVMSTSPLFGRGIKEIVPQFSTSIPIGSHSTYIGVLYRTGIIGFAIFSTALIVILKGIVLSDSENGTKKYRLTFALICCAFFITEDIDGADWLLVCALSVAGFLSNCNKAPSLSTASIPGR